MDEFIPAEEQCTQILRELVMVNTCQPRGNEETLVEWIRGRIPEGLTTETLHHSPGRASLIVKLEGKENHGGTAFAGHLDTVAVPDPDRWSSPPHEGAVKGGALFGRGSADMKGGVAAMLLALEHLAGMPGRLEKPVYFCFTADEEAGGRGIRSIVDGHYLDDVDELIVCEPSNEMISNSEKGALWLKITVSGVSSHASRPNIGTNAVEFACRLGKKIKVLVESEPPHPVLGRSTASVTRFSGGIMTNIIPSVAEMEMDIRTSPGVRHEWILKEVDRLCQELQGEDPKVGFKVEVTNDRPAIETPSGQPLIQTLRELGKPLGISAGERGHYFYTDASQFVPQIPVPFAIAGPGDDTLAHCTDEHIEISSVGRFARLYVEYVLNRG